MAGGGRAKGEWVIPISEAEAEEESESDRRPTPIG